MYTYIHIHTHIHVYIYPLSPECVKLFPHVFKYAANCISSPPKNALIALFSA